MIILNKKIHSCILISVLGVTLCVGQDKKTNSDDSTANTVDVEKDGFDTSEFTPTSKNNKDSNPVLPDRFIGDEHLKEELGINEFTAPSIQKVFEDLAGLPPIPDQIALRERPQKLPTDRATLALDMGFLMADGFVIVQCGKMNEVRNIALDLSRYGKAMGVGERVNRHAASILKNAEDGDLQSFKKNLSLTQVDVEQELVALRDPDLAHLLALGGWIRALDAATAATAEKFDKKQAEVLFQPDMPTYFGEILQGVAPEMRERRDINKIQTLLEELSQIMALPTGGKPTVDLVKKMNVITGKLCEASVGRQ